MSPIARLAMHRMLTRLWVAVACSALAIGIGTRASAQRARPIEFSESSRGESSTNAPVTRAERSRLDSLEQQISKSLDVFEPGDSLRGNAIPFHGPPPRPAVVPRDAERRGGLFDDDEAWVRADPFAGQTTLRDLLEIDPMSMDKGRRESARAAESPREGADWMGTRTVGDEFWQLPLTTKTRADDLQSQPPEELLLRPAERRQEVDRLFAAQEPEATWGFGQPDPFGVRGDEQFSQPKHANTFSHEPYQSLSGFKEAPGFSPVFGSQPIEQPQFGRSFAPSQPSPWVVEQTPKALTPVSVPDRRSWLPLLPTPPQLPSAQNTYEQEALESPVVEPAPRTTSPFRDPVRRGF